MPGQFYQEAKKERTDLSAILSALGEVEQKLESLVVYRGETTAPGAGDGSTLICSDLTSRPDYDGCLVVIKSGSYIGQPRQINGATTGGTVIPDIPFGGQIVTGIKFAILGIRVNIVEVAAIEAKLDGAAAQPATTVFTLQNNLLEQDAITFAAALRILDIELDMNNLTQACTVREHSQVDGVNYRQVSAKAFPGDFDPGTKAVVCGHTQKNAAYKITLQSSVLEGAPRDIPIRYTTRAI